MTSSPAISPGRNIIPISEPIFRYDTALFRWSPLRMVPAIGSSSVAVPSLTQVRSFFGPVAGQV